MSEVIRRVEKYDGQLIYKDGKVIYDLGNYLGGGAAGSVYQGVGYPNEKQVAVKVLKPVGFKLLPSGQLRSCPVIQKGKLLNQEQITGKTSMTIENIWWLIHPTTKQLLAAYEDPLRSQLRELPLPKCVEIWGWTPFGEDFSSLDHEDKRNMSSVNVQYGGNLYNIPLVSPKYLKWLCSRHKMCREMATMMRVGEHPNIVVLYEVLELIQDDKATLFLVLELIQGGELFDRIRAFKSGTPEDFARRYFMQLMSGIEYCHKMGVCHRDLKPENLLLSDLSDSAILKIADFGLSEVIFHAGEESHDEAHAHNKPVSAGGGSTGKVSPTHAGSPKLTLKRLKSVVGSPHYVAPEITTQDAAGYDGRAVDMWSAGVILYSLLTGSLPFEEEIRHCARYRRFQRWVDTEYAAAVASGADVSFPSWFFPAQLSSTASSLIIALLHHDPTQRLSATSALMHPWLWTDRPVPINHVANSSFGSDTSFPLATIKSRGSSSSSSRSQSSDHNAANQTEDSNVQQLNAQFANTALSSAVAKTNKSSPPAEVLSLPPPPKLRLPAQQRRGLDQEANRVREQQRSKEAAEKGRL